MADSYSTTLKSGQPLTIADRSDLQLADMRLSRNIAILGVSIMAGMIVPEIVVSWQIGADAEAESSILIELLHALRTLLQIKMFVGGLVGFILDNTVPGATRQQRGLVHDDHQIESDYSSSNDYESGAINQPSIENPYVYPQYVNMTLAKIPFIQYVPFVPPLSG